MSEDIAWTAGWLVFIAGMAWVGWFIARTSRVGADRTELDNTASCDPRAEHPRNSLGDLGSGRIL